MKLINIIQNESIQLIIVSVNQANGQVSYKTTNKNVRHLGAKQLREQKKLIINFSLNVFVAFRHDKQYYYYDMD